MAPKKCKKPLKAKPLCPGERAALDTMNKYTEALNNRWGEMGSRSRAGESILKEEEVESHLGSPEVKFQLIKMGMEFLLDPEKHQHSAKVETIKKMMTMESAPAEIFSNGDQSPLDGVDAQVMD